MLDRYVTLGRSGLRVSPLCLGTMTFGEDWVWVTSSLSDRTYDVIDAVTRIARDLGTTPARVAIAGVQGRPGVASSIVGARTLSQLEDSLGALSVRLSPEQVATLDAVTTPTLDFPAGFLRAAGSFGYGGTTINGETFPPNPLAPASDAERW